VFIQAQDGWGDHAIRAFRVGEDGTGGTKGQWIVGTVSLAALDGDWAIKAPRSNLEGNLGLSTVERLFDVRLGIRPGNKPAFMLTQQEHGALRANERRWFKPVADKIVEGRILPSEFIFYPYSAAGNAAFETERELESAVPTYYRSHLLPHRNELKSRS